MKQSIKKLIFFYNHVIWLPMLLERNANKECNTYIPKFADYDKTNQTYAFNFVKKKL